MLVITSHTVRYIELDLEHVLQLYTPQFIVTPTDDLYYYHFYTYYVVADQPPEP